MADDVKYLTPEGKVKLEKELKDLVEIRRPELAQKLKEAIADGDLKENANYHDTKEQQGLVESRIRDIEHILRIAVVIEENTAGVVNIGNTVVVLEDGEDEEENFKIVGAAEADPASGMISNESPIGAALLGRKKGEKVVANTPGGEIIFKIVDVI